VERCLACEADAVGDRHLVTTAASRSRGKEALRGPDRVGLASEAALHGVFPSFAVRFSFFSQNSDRPRKIPRARVGSRADTLIATL
jgi:hypothetical protein